MTKTKAIYLVSTISNNYCNMQHPNEFEKSDNTFNRLDDQNID